MKIFISACVALLLTFTLVICTSVSTKNIIENMKQEIYASESANSEDDISSDPGAVLEKVGSEWEKHRFLLCLSISHREADDIEISIKSARAALDAGDTGLYKVSLAALSEKLSKLAESEELSLEGIL